MHVSNTHFHKQNGREVGNFDLAVWEREGHNLLLVGSYVKFAQNSTMQSHLLDTVDRLLAKLALTTSYGASDTALITSPHANRRYGVA